jgi:Zn-dependent protease with chaperone function
MGIPTPEFKILLYGPGQPPGGLRARARFEGNYLVVFTHGAMLTVPAQQIHLKAGGYDGRQWLIVWVAQEGIFSAMLQGEAALEAFIELAPAEIGRQLHQAQISQTRSGLRFRLGQALLVLLLLLPVLALGLFWANADRLSQWAVSHISLEQERQLGELAYAQMRPSLKLLKKSHATAAVEAIGKRLTAESSYRYQFHVVVDPQINAYALPGGHILVNTGLIKAVDGAGEVAGVLAHEIGHVEQRHTLRNMVHALGWRALLGVALGNFSDGLWGDMAGRLGNLSYSRELESEADREGLKILRRAGVTPHGMETFFKKMAAGKYSAPALLSSHPASAERLAALRAASAQEPREDIHPFAIDWERVKADL